MSHAFEPLSGRIIHAAIAVHKALGPGFLESIYHGGPPHRLGEREGIEFENEAEVRIFFEGAEVGVHYLDLLVERPIVVELKAVTELDEIHYRPVAVLPQGHRSAQSAC